MTKAIFFDLFETLITEWEDDKLKAEHSMNDLRLDAQLFQSEWAARREQRFDGTFPDLRSCLVDILEAQNHSVDEHIMESVINDRVKAKTVPFMDIDQTIINMIHSIKQMGLKVGLISNCAPEEVTAWGSCELAPLFDDVVFSYNVKCAKPLPLIYEIACSNLSVKPEESIFVGDGGSNELEGATNIGMTAYHAAWYQPDWISAKISGYKKLKKPQNLVSLLKNDIN